MFDKEFDFQFFYRILRKHIYLFIAVFILVNTVAAAYLVKAKRVYQATATIEIAPHSANVLGRNVEDVANESAGYYWINREYYTTQYEIIKSRTVSSKVVENLGPGAVLNSLVPKRNEERSDKGGEKKEMDLVSIIQGKISVVPKKNSNIVKISVSDGSAETASFLANAVVDAYIDFNMEKKFTATKDAAKWLSEQSLNLKGQLETSEFSLYNFKQENEVLATTFEEKQRMLSERIFGVYGKLTEKLLYEKSLSAKIDELDGIDTESFQSVFSSDEKIFKKNAGSSTSMLHSLKMQYLDIQSKLTEKLQFYGEKHPEVKLLREKLGKIEKVILTEVKGIVSGYRLEKKTLGREIKNLKKMLREAQSNAIALNRLEIDYNKLKRDVETNKRLYDIVLERTKQADLTALLKSNNIRVIDRALTPVAPIKPRVRVTVLISLIIATLLSIVAVIVVEFFDTRIRDVDELEGIINKPVLGVFPRFSVPDDAKIREIAFEGSMHSPAVESLRTIRTNVRLSYPDGNIKSLLITSSASQEGKTTVSSNLAVSMSMAGRKVLLVDTDMRKPRVHKLFGKPNTLGISNFMLDEKGLDEVIQKNVYGDLDALFCGPIPPNPAEMIESNKFKDMVAKLKDKYDMVIFDSPPIVAVSDAAAISPLVDGIILVVKIKQISRDILKRGLRLLSNPSISIFGTVVNNVEMKTGSKYGSYYYQYQYRYYGENEETEKA